MYVTIGGVGCRLISNKVIQICAISQLFELFHVLKEISVCLVL